jgi:hypothetical protein
MRGLGQLAASARRLVARVSPTGMSEPFDIDLAAAELRAQGSDMPVLLNGLAEWFESSLPGVAEVERRRGGMFSSRREVVRITCRLGDETYTLTREGARAVAGRARTVRGITLKTEMLGLAEWLAALTGALRQRAQLAGASMQALRELLT